MSGSPNTYDGSVDKRSQMHIGTIHAQHDVEVAHQNEFLLQSIEMGGSIYNLLILFCPFIHYRGFILTTSEKEDVAVWMIVDKLLDNFFPSVVWGKSCLRELQMGLYLSKVRLYVCFSDR